MRHLMSLSAVSLFSWLNNLSLICLHRKFGLEIVIVVVVGVSVGVTELNMGVCVCVCVSLSIPFSFCGQCNHKV